MIAFDRIVFEQPAGADLRAFRLSITIDGQPCTAKQFAESIGINEQNVNDYETEKRGVQMPASTWVFARITWDVLARAQWINSLPKRDT